MRKPSIAVVVAVVVTALGGFAWGVVSYYRGVGREMERSSKLLAIAIYELQMAKGAAGIPDTLADPVCITTLQQIEDKEGKVLSFRVEDTRVDPFGLSVFITLRVTRERRTGREVLYRHSLGAFTYMSEEP